MLRRAIKNFQIRPQHVTPIATIIGIGIMGAGFRQAQQDRLKNEAISEARTADNSAESQSKQRIT